MTRATVTELPRTLEPVTRDPFIEGLNSMSAPGVDVKPAVRDARVFTTRPPKGSETTADKYRVTINGARVTNRRGTTRSDAMVWTTK